MSQGVEGRERAESGDPSVRRGGAARWVAIVSNANSGAGHAEGTLSRAVQRLKERGFGARVARSELERRRLVAEASNDPGCQAMLVLGGDGTVAALINECPKQPVAVLPTGTENLFAAHFGFTSDLGSVVEAIAAGRARSVDVGIANGRRFCLMAGFGFDADVVTRHHEARVRATGVPRPTSRLAYIEPIIRASISYRFPRISVQLDDPPGSRALVGTTVFVFNLPRYALGLPFAPRARDDDGMLDVLVFRKPGPFHALRYLWLVFRGLHLGRRSVIHRLARRLRVSSDATIPVQLDGDPAGHLDPGVLNAWTIEALPAALQVVIPPARVRATESHSTTAEFFKTVV